MYSFQLTNLANKAFWQFEVLLDVEELLETAAEGGGLPCVWVQQVGAHLGQYSGDILPLLAGGEPGGPGVVAVERVGWGFVRVLTTLVIPALQHFLTIAVQTVISTIYSAVPLSVPPCTASAAVPDTEL